MDKTIKLPSGKIINLSRFVALLPDDKAKDDRYSLILEGSNQAIALDEQEAISVKEHLKLKSSKNHNGVWDREEQLRKNQPKLKKLREWIDKMKQELPSPEKEAANLWAEARIQGIPTADDKSLDADIIICAHYKLLEEEYPGRYIVIATTNVKHLSHFAEAKKWQEIEF
jgi:hypothetical protein